MISKLSAKYQFCSIRTADTRDGQLTTPGVYTWVVRELSIVCPSFVHRLYPPTGDWAWHCQAQPGQVHPPAPGTGVAVAYGPFCPPNPRTSIVYTCLIGSTVVNESLTWRV